MSNKFSTIITDFLVNQGAVMEEDREIYLYGFNCFILTLFQTAILLVIGVATNSIIDTVMFISAFAMIRKYTGGYHANTKIACTICTSIMLIGTISLKKIIYGEQMKLLIFLMLVFSLIIIISYSPIQNQNKKLNSIQLGENRRKAITCSVILTVFSLLLYRHFVGITFDIVMAQFIVALMMIISVLRRGGEIYEEDS